MSKGEYETKLKWVFRFDGYAEGSVRIRKRQYLVGRRGQTSIGVPQHGVRYSTIVPTHLVRRVSVGQASGDGFPCLSVYLLFETRLKSTFNQSYSGNAARVLYPRSRRSESLLWRKWNYRSTEAQQHCEPVQVLVVSLPYAMGLESPKPDELTVIKQETNEYPHVF